MKRRRPILTPRRKLILPQEGILLDAGLASGTLTKATTTQLSTPASAAPAPGGIHFQADATTTTWVGGIYTETVAAEKFRWATDDITVCGRIVLRGTIADDHSHGHFFAGCGHRDWAPCGARLHFKTPSSDPCYLRLGAMINPTYTEIVLDSASADWRLDDAWFIAMTYEASAQRWTTYAKKDGDVSMTTVATSSDNNDAYPDGADFWIGAGDPDYCGINADMRNIMVWRGLFSDTDLFDQSMAWDPITTTALWAHYKLDDASDNLDYSGNDRHLTWFISGASASRTTAAIDAYDPT